MAEGETSIDGYLDSADTRSTLAAVRALGAGLRGGGGPAAGHDPDSRRRPVRSDTAPRSTSATRERCCACCPGWLAGQPSGIWMLDGDESIRRRPVDRIAAPLRLMGASSAAGTTACRRCASKPRRCAASLRAAGGKRPGQVVPALRRPAGRGGDAASSSRMPSRDHSERMLAPRVRRRARRRLDGRAADGAPGAWQDRRAGRLLLGGLLHRRRPAGARQRRDPDRGRPQPDPDGPAADPRQDGGGAGGRVGRRAGGRAGRAHPDPVDASCGAPRSPAPRCRCRSTSCRWWRLQRASPRARTTIRERRRAAAQGERPDRDCERGARLPGGQRRAARGRDGDRGGRRSARRHASIPRATTGSRCSAPSRGWPHARGRGRGHGGGRGELSGLRGRPRALLSRR